LLTLKTKNSSFVVWALYEKRNSIVVGKSITTNPGYFSSGRFLNGEGVKRLLFSQLGSLVKD
jgi:hypothetical protein